MTAAAPPDPASPRYALAALRHPVPAGVIAISLLIEVVLVAADHGLIGSLRWRILAYQYGAFWAGLLHGWQPNFAAQPATMFVSHAFLHAGPAHLAGNLLVLAMLGPRVLTEQGPARFTAVWLAAILGGGLAFGLLATSPAPMVGASGALFGLAGALLVWQTRTPQPGRTRARRLLVLAAGLTGLLAINLPMWWLLAGQLAWQTHLGGTLAGALVAAITRRAR